jgi:hypothetical protein
MKPGHGEVLIAEGDVEVAEEEELLVQEFRRQLEEGMWAAVPERTTAGRREARMVKAFEDIPRDADRVIFFPRAAGGAYDPGRERRAEQRARQLLQSCVNDEEWSMYRDLGFIRVWGGMARVPRRGRNGDDPRAGAPYAYLVYPHKPIVAYLPQTRELLNEYCVEFPDETRPYGSSRLPDSDDVLAKWMALTGDEQHLIATANMHLPGRQVDPKQVRRDLWRLSQWERERLRRTPRSPGGVPAP